MKPSALLLAVCGLVWLPAMAQVSASAATLGEALQDKTLVGTARLRHWGFEVYDARLWAPPDFDIRQFEHHRFALELTYLRGFKGSDIAERSIGEMQGLATIEPAQAARWLQAMNGLFPDVKRGDRITGVHVPDSGARFFLNAQPLGEVADDAFSRLFFGIWLSPRTSQPRMREALIQRIEGPAR